MFVGFIFVCNCFFSINLNFVMVNSNVWINLFGFSVTVLCSNRVSQMTKTYNDIEAVTRLLEEVSSRFIVHP